MKNISPISKTLREQVTAASNNYIQQASHHFKRDFPGIAISFDLRGRNAGMYKVERGKRVIRYNPYLFAKYFDDNLENTVPHEVAHYITDLVYGLRNIRPHGKEWQQVMLIFGAVPSRTHNFDMQGIPTRQQQRFSYHCGCQVYELTTRRHNMIQKGQRRYLCRQCKNELKLKQA